MKTGEVARSVIVYGGGEASGAASTASAEKA